MAVRFQVIERSEAGGAQKGTEVVLDTDVITLGRDKKCEVVLGQMAVSRAHARVSRDGGLFFIEDLGSSYGTQVNGRALPKGEKRLLRNGDIIAIAQYDVTFTRVTQLPEGRSDKTSMVARKVVQDVMRGLRGGEGPYFRVMNGPREGQRVELADAQELVFGREEGVDVVLRDDLVSRRHAKVRRDWSGTHVEDLGSRNGIKVNKKRVAKKTLKDRDELEIGGIRLLYLDPSEVREAPVMISDEDSEEHTSAPAPEEERLEPSHSDGGAADAQAAPHSEPEEEAADEPEEGDSPTDEEREQEPEQEEDAQEEEPSEDEPPEEGEDEDGEEAALAQPASGARYFSAGAMKDPRSLAVIGAMAVFALLAIALFIAIMAGA
jgi:pSer/pThr/pTyr-binding forkhead associated (FHA) protein